MVGPKKTCRFFQALLKVTANGMFTCCAVLSCIFLRQTQGNPVASWRNCLCYRNCLSKELFTVYLTAPVFSSSLVSTFFIFLLHIRNCLQYLLLFVIILISECFISFLFSLSRSFCCFFPCICLYLLWVCLDYSDYEFGFELFHHRISHIFQYLYFKSMTFKSDYSNDLPLLVQCVILFSIPSTMFVFIVVVVSVPRIDAFSTLSSIKFIYLITYVIHSWLR